MRVLKVRDVVLLGLLGTTLTLNRAKKTRENLVFCVVLSFLERVRDYFTIVKKEKASARFIMYFQAYRNVIY
jgi:hypothetical protein